MSIALGHLMTIRLCHKQMQSVQDTKMSSLENVFYHVLRVTFLTVQVLFRVRLYIKTFNSFIHVLYLALLPLIPMFLYMYITVLSFLGFHKEKSMKEGIRVWVICVCKLLVKPWQPIYCCVGKWSQEAMVTLSESLSPGGWHTGANKGDTYLFLRQMKPIFCRPTEHAKRNGTCSLLTVWCPR